MNRRRMKKILKESEENLSALDWLRDLHYQICNGGLEQACDNGYVDRLLENYDSAEAWVDALEEELNLETPSEKECVKAADMIAKAIDKIEYVQECPDCGGEGSWTEEDEDGESYTETCSRCNGEGEIDCDSAADVDFSVYNSWADEWDSMYYKEINSDLVDDATEQSHNHSRVLDMVQGVNESTKVTLTVKQLKKLITEGEEWLNQDAAGDGGKRVRQISVDIIPDGTFSDDEIIRAVEEALMNVECEVVGGPEFTDASWSSDEYGLQTKADGNPSLLGTTMKTKITIKQLKKLLKESVRNESRFSSKLADVKKLVNESIDVKAFDEVEIGDIGTDYNEIPVVITKVGTVAELCPDIADEKWFSGDHPAVEVQRFDGEVLGYVYDVSGVMVPRDWGNIKNISAI